MDMPGLGTSVHNSSNSVPLQHGAQGHMELVGYKFTFFATICKFMRSSLWTSTALVWRHSSMVNATHRLVLGR